MEKNIETTCRALILNVMVCMMEVDGIIDEREIERIGDVYEEIAGFRLEQGIRDKLIGTVVLKKAEVLDLIRARTEILDNAHRKRVFRAGLVVLEADLRTPHGEWRFLRDVGSALGMTKDEIDSSMTAG